MFAKHKALLSSASSVFKGRQADGQGPLGRVLKQGAQLMEGLKKPFVAPALVVVALLASIGLFLWITADPNAGAPSVQVALAKIHEPKAQAASAPQVLTSGQQAFTLDSLGLFQDATAEGFAPPGGAVITLPQGTEESPTGPKQAPQPLPQAPIAGVVQASNDGPLPVIGPNGQTPSAVYARPFKSDGRPFVALVVGGLGINPVTTKAAIEQLPPEVTLSFVPYAQGLQGWIDLARAQGHEVLIEIPMQPVNYPDNDPGPQTLLANSRTEELASKLNWALSRASGYFGVSNYQGGAFFKDRAGTASFLGALKSRGLSFIDDGIARDQGGAWGRASAERIIDSQITSSAITAQLEGLESTAKAHGQALGTGFAYPVTLSVILRWSQGLNKRGLQLAPASALIHR